MKRSFKIITAVVLTLGIAGCAGAYGKHRWGNPETKAKHVISYVTEELDLDSDQSEKLITLTDQMMQTGKILRNEMAPMHNDITALISADTFDQDHAMEILNTKTALMNQQAPDILAALGGFLDSLNPEQKAEVIELIQHKRGHRGWKDHH
jgi:Spy/CpxP family protein refolding chaperone